MSLFTQSPTTPPSPDVHQPHDSEASMPLMQASIPLSDAVWNRLLDEASAPYRAVGRTAYHFARGKLRHDPVFRALLERGILRADSRLLDLGCGQGLVGALLHAVDQVHRTGDWPSHVPAPLHCRYRGLDLMPSAVQRAVDALARQPSAPVFECADASTAVLPPSDLVLLLDVLHYVDLPSQQVLLQHVIQTLAPGGHVVLRVGDASRLQRHAWSQWVDRVVVRLRGYKSPPHFGRPLSSWIALLNNVGFEVSTLPMSQGTPFANVLLLARVPAGALLSLEDAFV